MHKALNNITKVLKLIIIDAHKGSMAVVIVVVMVMMVTMVKARI